MAESPPSPSPSRPFQLLADDLTWFIKCPELRVFHVTTSPADRALVLALVARTEGHAHNRSPYFVLEESITSDDIGFRSRAHRIAATHAERRALLAKEGIALDPVAEVDDAAAPVVAFAGQLDGCLRAQANAKELHGLTVVLAPTIVQKGTTFVDELVRLVRTPQLALVRWILIEVVPAPLCAPLQSALGEAMLTATALVPEAERRADMEARLAGMAAAPAGASPQVQLGFAGPRNVIAPPRFANLGRNPQSPEVKALLAKELGPLAALVGEGGALLRRQIAGAALAARDGRHAEAAAL